MPSEEQLPPGARRDFVAFLFRCYRDADRPTLAEISKAIRNGDFRASASTETIRRMLRGETVPRNWAMVETVMLALAEIEGVDPDEDWKYGRFTASSRWHLRHYWNLALDEPEPAAVAAEQDASAAGNRPILSLQPGELVNHDGYGLGRVLSIAGGGDDPEAKVDFGEEHGIKHLLLRYAPLEKL